MLTIRIGKFSADDAPSRRIVAPFTLVDSSRRHLVLLHELVGEKVLSDDFTGPTIVVSKDAVATDGARLDNSQRVEF